MSGIRFKGSSRRRILDSWPNSSMRIVLNSGIHRLKSGVNNSAAWLVFGAVHLGANVPGFYSVDEHLHVIVAIYAVVDYTVDWKTSCSLFCNLPRVASLYEIVCKYLHLVRKLAFLCNSIWPPSAILDLLGKVVGSSTKAYSWWLCKNVGLSSLKSCVWIFVVHAWKSYSWSQVLFYFCRLDFQKLREHCSYPKGSITYCPEWRVLSVFRPDRTRRVAAFPIGANVGNFGVPAPPSDVAGKILSQKAPLWTFPLLQRGMTRSILQCNLCVVGLSQDVLLGFLYWKIGKI